MNKQEAEKIMKSINEIEIAVSNIELEEDRIREVLKDIKSYRKIVDKEITSITNYLINKNTGAILIR